MKQSIKCKRSIFFLSYNNTWLSTWHSIKVNAVPFNAPFLINKGNKTSNKLNISSARVGDAGKWIARADRR